MIEKHSQSLNGLSFWRKHLVSLASSYRSSKISLEYKDIIGTSRSNSLRKSSGKNPLSSLILVFAPLIKRALIGLVVKISSLVRTAKWRGVKPLISYELTLAPWANMN